MSASAASLTALARSFGDTLTALIADCFPKAPELEAVTSGTRVKIQPIGQTEKVGGIPLCVDGLTLAWLRIDILCRLDTSGGHLAVDRSKIWVVAELDSTPAFRFEYVLEAQTVPHSHIHVHAERGALSHLLSRAGHGKPHNLSSLHLPTGGRRFRPSVEDVVQFLIGDCGFDGEPDWKSAVLRTRAEWRRTQMRTAVRALPQEAANRLQAMGYTAIPPHGAHPAPSVAALESW